MGSGGRTRVAAAIVVASVLAAVGAGCGVRVGDRADLVFINGVEPESLDPALITGQPEIRLAGSLFEGLLRFDRSGQAVPGTAERWEIADDGLTYTFHLRPDARWSNGDPVTAHDFVGSWRRTLAPETGSDYASLLYCLEGAEAVNTGSAGPEALGVRALDAATLEVRLASPTAYFLDLCAFATFLPVHLPTVEAAGGAWILPGTLVGNGPYRLEAWRINDRIRLVRSETYWDRENVALETIDALPISDANTALNFFVTGEADLMLDKGLIPPGMGDVLRTKPWFHAAPFLGTYFMRFNTSQPPFDDPRVRRAFSLAIDRARIVEKITRNGEEIATSLVPPGCGRGYRSPEGPGHDPEEARRLLAEAGFPGGTGFPLVRYLYPTQSVEKNIAVELQNMWRETLGVEIALEKQEWKVYLNTLKSLEYEIGRSSWIGDYNDPNTFLDLFIAGSGNNRTGFANPRFDALIDAAARETDPDTRYAILAEAEALLVSTEAVVAPVYYYVGVQFYHADQLGGVEANLLDEHPFRDMYWKEASGPRGGSRAGEGGPVR